jgi:hypothetical protein
MLAAGVAGAFDCQYAHSSQGSMLFFGVDLDHEIATFTFGYIYRTINRLAAQFMGKSQQRRLTPKRKKKVRASYCLGCADVVYLRLQMQKARTPLTTSALVPIKEALIKEKCEQYGVYTSKQKNDDLSSRAFWCGKRDGAGIDHGRRGLKEKKARPIGIEYKG